MIVVVLITAGDGRQQQCRAASQKTMSGMRWLSLRVQLPINAACLIDDEQAEACNNAVSLQCIVVVDLMLYVCLTWSAMVAWLPRSRFPRAATSRVETSHTMPSTRSRRQQNDKRLSRPSNRKAAKER
jgi:hypothetical protein